LDQAAVDGAWRDKLSNAFEGAQFTAPIRFSNQDGWYEVKRLFFSSVNCAQEQFCGVVLRLGCWSVERGGVEAGKINKISF